MSKANVADPVAPSMDVRDAVRAARRHFSQLFQGEASLEEAVLSDEGDKWLITLGFPNPWIDASRREKALMKHDMLGAVGRPQFPTLTYKLFEVDVRTGQVRAMRIRKVE